MDQEFDVIVVGAGHAGIEATLAAARLGCRTAVFTMNIDTIGLMSCNPSIGGPAKGQIVGEIDALGGEMGVAADATQIQMKILNRSRGPAVQCLRSQNDKHDYNQYMKNRLLTAKNVSVKQGLIQQLILEDGVVKGIITDLGKTVRAHCVVITAGTFLKAKMHVGLESSEGGRIGEKSVEHFSDTLRPLFRMGRLKTGTPPRLDRRSIDFDQLKEQPGDHECLRFSFRTPPSDAYKRQISCFLTHTTTETHDIILNNLDRSPMYTDVIKGVGPRYCPSIEDKVVRFKDNPSHHIFIEPEGRDTIEIYPQGLNTSLPEDVQDAMLRSMPGLANVEILKPGYAVEYDFFYPDQLHPTLETRPVKNLYFAGQINGTSGYEEAAGQGIIAGINAGLRAQNKPPFILKREDSYIGTLIDDLITKNIFEPYRMMTSRSEYRLLFRQDNCHFRLSEKAYAIGLLTDDEIALVRAQLADKEACLKALRKTSTNEVLVSKFGLKQKTPLSTFLKRPEVTIDDLYDAGHIGDVSRETLQQASIEIKYDGYIQKQMSDIDRFEKLDALVIPDHIDFGSILGLKKESSEKFAEFRPKTLYEAKKIAGINPADIMVLVTYLEKERRA